MLRCIQDQLLQSFESYPQVAIRLRIRIQRSNEDVLPDGTVTGSEYLPRSCYGFTELGINDLILICQLQRFLQTEIKSPIASDTLLNLYTSTLLLPRCTNNMPVELVLYSHALCHNQSNNLIFYINHPPMV